MKKNNRMPKKQISDRSPSRTEQRLNRERRTIRVMIDMYCDHKHRSQHLCDDCGELFEYAMVRIDKCPFKSDKPTCAKCPIHCYKPDMRAKVRQVMRFAGPRMIFYHPMLALMHVWDGLISLKNEKGW